MYTKQIINLDYPLPIKLIQFDYEKNSYLTIDRVEMHWHKNIEIILPITGELTYSVNGRSGILKEKQVLIVNSEEIHRTEWTMNTETYKGYCIQIDYAFFKTYYKDLDNILFYNTLNENENNEIRTIFKSIVFAINNKNENYDIFVISQLLLMLYYLLDYSKTSKPMTKSISSQRSRMRNILAYIHINYNKNIDPDTIAKDFDISLSHLFREFKANTGISPKKYIDEYRLQRAVEQLLNSDDGIVEIAFNNGFTNVNSFYKMFHKKYGITPKSYKIQYQKIELSSDYKKKNR